jgi:hypothetical protein
MRKEVVNNQWAINGNVIYCKKIFMDRRKELIEENRTGPCFYLPIKNKCSSAKLLSV